MKGDAERLTARPMVGQMYMYYYDAKHKDCLLYTSDAADEEDSVDLGGRRIIKKKKKKKRKKRKRKSKTSKIYTHTSEYDRPIHTRHDHTVHSTTVQRTYYH